MRIQYNCTPCSPPTPPQDTYTNNGTLDGTTLKLRRTDAGEVLIDLSGLLDHAPKGGITSGKLVIDTQANTKTINVLNKDGTSADIDVSALPDTNTDTVSSSGELVDGNNTLRVTRSDDTTFDIDVTPLNKDTNTVSSSGELVNDNNTLRVTRSDNTTFDIDVTALNKNTDVESFGIVPNTNTLRLVVVGSAPFDVDLTPYLNASGPYIVSGVFTERDNGYWLDFTRSDTTLVNVDMTEVMRQIAEAVYQRVMAVGHRINIQTDDYTLLAADFDGRTVVIADKGGDQTITLPRPPDESFVGKTVVVYKHAGAPGTFTYLKASADVEITPADVSPLRRVGSSAALLYLGNGRYTAFGELP